MEPNDNGPGPNVPPVSVGPTSSTNLPGNFVLPATAPWSGWPDSATDGGPWDTPPLEPMVSVDGTWWGGEWSGFGYGRQNGAAGYLRRVATVMTCIDLASRQLASFPLYVVDRDRKRLPVPSWHDGGPEPELYGSWSAFMKAAVNSYLLCGEAVLYATARFADGYPSRFVALNPRTLHIDDDGEWWLGQRAGQGEHLDRDDVCHIPYQVLPGHRRGIGPLQWAARHLVSAAALTDYALDIAQHGVWAVLKHPDRLNAKQADDLKARWAAARANPSGAPAVLSGGIELEVLSLSPQDMALLDLHVFDLQMIAAAFGVPSFLVNLPQASGLTYSSTEMLADWHWRATLRPYAQSFSDAMSAWLLPRGTVVEWNPDRYVQPGLEERARTYQMLHGIVDENGRRAITVDEIRAAERFDAATQADLVGTIS